MCVTLAGLLLALFSCENGTRGTAPVKTAARAMRWTLVALLAAQLLELTARVIAEGFISYFRKFIHVLDACVLLSVFVVDLSVSDQRESEALTLLISFRILRVVKLVEAFVEHAAQ